MLTTHAVRAALILAGSGALCRFALRQVETRWQIVGFWCVVLAYQMVLRPQFGARISLASTMLDLGCVTVAITGMKFAIEGRLTH